MGLGVQLEPAKKSGTMVGKVSEMSADNSGKDSNFGINPI
jgi:hypothetical protein